MSLIVFVFLIGAGLIGFGIYQKKTYYGRQQVLETEIVDFVPYNGGTGLGGLAISAMSRVVGMKHPVILVSLADGTEKRVRLNITVTDDIFKRYPDLDIGGRISVTYFGKNPSIAYLQNHPLAQMVTKVSLALLIGIGLIIVDVLMVIVYITTPSV